MKFDDDPLLLLSDGRVFKKYKIFQFRVRDSLRGSKKNYDFAEYICVGEEEGHCDTMEKRKGRTMDYSSGCPNKRVRLEQQSPMPATCSSSLSLAMTRRSKENVEITNNSGNGKFDSMYMKEHLDCFTFLCKQFVKQDKNDLKFTLDNTNNLIDLKMGVENCQNMKLIDSDVDVNLMFANL